MIREADVDAALPSRGFLREYVEYGKRVSDAHSIFHVGVGLSIMSQSIPVSVCLPMAAPIYANIYTLLVGKTRKSFKTSCIDMGLRVLRTVHEDSVLEKPGSKEFVIESLRVHPRTLYPLPEFGSFLQSALGSGPMGTMKTFLLEIFDGNPIGHGIVKSKANEGRSRGKVPNPRVSVLAGVAPEFLSAYTEPVDWTSGFFGRFLTFWAEPERHGCDQSSDPARFDYLVSYLRSMQNTDTLGHGQNTCLGLSLEAKALWATWISDLERRSEERDSSTIFSSIDSVLLGIPAIARRMSLILGWDLDCPRNGDSWEISLATIQAVIRFCELHATSVLLIGNGLTAGQYMKSRLAVLKSLRQEGELLGTIITRARMPKRSVLELLESLMEERLVERLSQGGEVTYRLSLAGRIHLGQSREVPAKAKDNPDAQIIPLFPVSQTEPSLLPAEPAPSLADLNLEDSEVYDP